MQKKLRTTAFDPEKKNPKMISDIFSFKQTFIYLSKYKKAKLSETAKWLPIQRLKYIETISQQLGI